MPAPPVHCQTSSRWNTRTCKCRSTRSSSRSRETHLLLEVAQLRAHTTDTGLHPMAPMCRSQELGGSVAAGRCITQWLITVRPSSHIWRRTQSEATLLLLVLLLLLLLLPS